MTEPNDRRRFSRRTGLPTRPSSPHHPNGSGERSYYDPAKNIPHAPPNFGRDLIPTIITFSGRSSSYNQVYRNPDQAVRESLENARFMRNDTSIMECLESRMRAVALLNWDIEPENKRDLKQVQLAADMTDILKRTPYFTKYRYALMDAIWYGRYAMQHRYALAPIQGKQRFVIASTRPVNGDKLVFRWDDGSGKYQDGQVGIRVGSGFRQKDILAGTRKVEMTDQGMAYFLENWERPLLAIHRHITEDGAYEDPLSAGRINGVGIRDRIYWCWFQKQETLAMLMEVIQRTGTGFTIYRYPAGNAHAKQEVREMAEQQTQSNIILMPSSPGDPTMDAYDLKRIEPSTGGIDALQTIIHQFFGHQIKRYILGQTLSSEAHPTGLGSGMANLHQDTFAGIVNFDAQNLAETLTTETLKPLKEFNFPWARDIPLYFRIHTQEADPRVQLAAFKAAWDMGAKIRGTDVLDAIGSSRPQPGEDVLCNPQLVPKSDAATTNANPAGASSTQPQPPEDSPIRYQAGASGPWTEEDKEEHPRAPKGSPNGGQFIAKNEMEESIGRANADEKGSSRANPPNEHEISKTPISFVDEGAHAELERRTDKLERSTIRVPKVGSEKIELVTNARGQVSLKVYDQTGRKSALPNFAGIKDYRDAVKQIPLGHRNKDGTITVDDPYVTGQMLGGSLGDVSEEELKLKLKNVPHLTGLTILQERDLVRSLVKEAQGAESRRMEVADKKTGLMRRQSDVTIVVGEDGSAKVVKNADKDVQDFYKDTGKAFVQPNHDRSELLPKSRAFDVFKDNAYLDSVHNNYLVSLELEKAQHPDYWLDKTQDVLDLAGNVPILGAVPDLLNAAVYAARGDSANASLSTLAALPLVGDAASVAKLTRKAKQTLEATKAAHKLKIEELAGRVAKLANGQEKAAVIEEIGRRVSALEALGQIEKSLDDVTKHLQQFSDVASFRKSIDEMADGIAKNVSEGKIDIKDLNTVLNRRYDQVLASIDVPGKGKLPAPIADERVTIKPTRLGDPKYIQNTVKNHITSMLSEEDLVHHLHTNTGDIVLKWGHNISTNGNDVITYNPKTKTVSLWDNKVTRREGSPLETKGSPTYNKVKSRNDAITEAKDVIKRSQLPDTDKEDAIKAIKNGKARLITATSGNYDNSTIHSVPNRGTK